MPISVVLPQIGSDSLKDQVISLLVEKNGLTAKEIYSKIQKTRQVTYQATHKALNELTNKGVLEKKQTHYSINKKWIEELKKFADTLEQKNNAMESLPGENQVIHFDKLYYFLENMLHLFSSDVLYKDCDHNYGGGILTHLWWPLSFDDQNYKRFIHMASAHESYIIVPGNSPVDQWLKAYYDKAGFKGIMLGVDYKIEDDLAIVGDYLIYIFFPKELKKKINELYSNTNMTEAINKGILETILMEKTNITVTIIKNKETVKQYWEKLLPHFGKKPVWVKN